MLCTCARCSMLAGRQGKAWPPGHGCRCGHLVDVVHCPEFLAGVIQEDALVDVAPPCKQEGGRAGRQAAELQSAELQALLQVASSAAPL